MRVFETSCLDNTICEYAYKLGYTHIDFDEALYKIVESEMYGYDWIEEGSVDGAN
jgi:hypothetical protein